VHRLSPTLRALLFVPLFAAGVDQARAVVLCGSDAQGCLEAAGRGWIGLWGVALIALYSVALAWGVARAAEATRSPVPRASFARLWLVGTAGIAATCAGQALLAAALGGAPLGGGWLGLLALCVLAGALLALALRVAPALRGALHAPRPRQALRPLWLAPAPLGAAAGRTPARRPRGRAPPLTI
jgi:hypothetical protein